MKLSRHGATHRGVLKKLLLVIVFLIGGLLLLKQIYLQNMFCIWRLNRSSYASVRCLGKSVDGRDINIIRLSSKNSNEINHRKRILVLSGQHGYEITPIIAMHDLINELSNTKDRRKIDLLRHTEIAIIPVVNPDGAYRFRRCNSNDVDLNRDWFRRTQPETQVVYNLVKQYKPDIILDLHEGKPYFIEVQQSQLDRRTLRIARQAVKLGEVGIIPRISCKYKDSALSHRFFIKSGIPSMLMETPVTLDLGRRKSKYSSFVLGVAQAIACTRY